MRLHVLAGSSDLLRPAVLEQEQVARLFGPEVRLATARWLELGPDVVYHDFLRDEARDRRIETFARALRQDFGTRSAPLIVLPDLLSEAAAPEAASEGRLSGPAVLERIWAHDGSDTILLSAIALPVAGPGGIWEGTGILLAPGAAASLDALRTACLARGIPACAVETQVIELGPERGTSAAPWRNALAGRLATHLESRLAAAALTLDPGPGRAALVSLLEVWSRAGIEPAFDPRREDFARLAEHVLAGLLSGAVHG
jgi:hypothetical protein